MTMPSSNHDMVDSIECVDLSVVTVADIRWQHGTFRTFSSGSGRDKKYWSRSGVQTSIGDVQEELWYRIAEHVAKRDGEGWLVDALVEWECVHNYRELKSAELREEALCSYSHRLFDNPRWVLYIPFNRKFRPQVLETAGLVTIMPNCCNIPGETTQAQIDHAYQHQICCPHCGRWTEFSIVGEADPPWEEY